ncbi:MAG: hypothetical protein ACYDC5_12830 [Candidatus Dormibacteria bacterium]
MDGRTVTVEGGNHPVDAATAAAEAQAAALIAGVVITDVLDVTGARRVNQLAEGVWGPAVGTALDLITALAHAGGVALLAERDRVGQERADVGFALGFLGWSDELHLHSHQVGVASGFRGQGVGLALKLAQREACLEHDVTLMRWTFDPLLAANAHFNLARLGAVGTAFLSDFYGQMADAINAGDRSDRLEVSWRLDRALPPRHPVSLPIVEIAVLEADQEGWPHLTKEPLRPGASIAIPGNYSELRELADPRAPAWRRAVGETLAVAFAAGLIVTGFRASRYLLAELAPG